MFCHGLASGGSGVQPAISQQIARIQGLYRMKS
jgi:hypothetical protein